MNRDSSRFLLSLIVLSLAACSKFEDRLYILKFPELPTVRTYAPENITSHTACLSGSIESTGGSTITESGINIYISGCVVTPGPCQVPGFNEWRYSDNNSVGHFSVFLRDLKPNTTYHYRAFAKNEFGTSFGDMQILVTDEGK